MWSSNQFIETDTTIVQYFSNAFLFLVMISLFLVWRMIWGKRVSKKKPPPSPRKLPILGNLHQLSALTHRSFQSLGTKHGPVMLLHFGRKPVIIVQSADAASEILRTHDLMFASKPESKTTRRLLYDMRNISAAPYGEYWRKLRSILVLQILSNKRVQSFRAIREEETGLLMEKIESFSSPVNLSELFMSLTNDVICRSAFGRKYSGSGEDGKKFFTLVAEIMYLLASFNIGEYIPFLSWINRVNGFNYRVEKVAKEFDAFLEQKIEEHLINARAKDDRARGDINILDILLNVYEDNISIDRVGVKAIILDVLIGGTATSFATLEWAMTELLRNPMMMKKLQDEVRGILNGKQQDIMDEDLEKMQYLKAVIKETLRFHPPIPFLAREPCKDVKIMGYDIAGGTMVIINTWAIGRDPASWDDPDKFHPERFLSCSIDFKGQDFELIPFGAGRRRCPGTAFAMANIELVLANLVQKFEWELPNGMKGEDLDCEEVPGISLHRKNPLLAVPKCYF